MGQYDFAYVHTDIPEGMTIREWRAQRARQNRARRRSPRWTDGFARIVRGLIPRRAMVRRARMRHSSGAHASISP